MLALRAAATDQLPDYLVLYSNVMIDRERVTPAWTY